MELFVIGDLHLGDGGQGDDFRADDERALVSFLFHLSRVPDALLVLNGDIIDFSQIQPRPQMWYDELLGATEDDSLLKLERALPAHGPVFDALGRFAAAGGRVHWLLGDRDVDVAWPRLQARLRERINAPDGDVLSFGAYLQRGGVHIEHGHACDPVACVDTDRWMLHDPWGVPRLERTVATRLAEEFGAPLDRLAGWEMVDNVLPHIPAALLVLRQALPDRAMHPVLAPAVRVLLDALVMLRSDEELDDAAARLGVSRQLIGWLASVAGWMSRVDDEKVPLRVPEVTSLRRAFDYGASLEDGAQLAQFAPPVLASLPARSLYASTTAGRRAVARRLYEEQTSVLGRAAALVEQRPGLKAICFGHTRRAIDARLRFDDGPGWPVPSSAARYFNNGCWGRALQLAELAPEQRTAAYITDPAHHRVLRDYLRIEWPGDGEPAVETGSWN